MRIWHGMGLLGSLSMVAALLVGCGGSSTMTKTNRGLKSITVSPATADGGTSGGKVQFTATAHWSATPLTTTPFSANWVVCQNNEPVKSVTVSTNGLATCGSSAKGVYDVNAWSFPINDGPTCLTITSCGGGCTIEGSAQLTCP